MKLNNEKEVALMNVSSSTSVGSQYLSSSSTQKTQHNHHGHKGGKPQDTVEVSAAAKEKYAQSQGNLSSDFDPTTELSAADKKDLLTQMKADLSSSDSTDADIPPELKDAIAQVKSDLSSVDLETASDADISNLLTKVHSTLDAAKPTDSEGSGSPVVSASPVDGTPHGGHRGGGTHGKGSASSDDAATVKDLLAALTDAEDTNGDGVVDEKDQQTTASQTATELKSKLTEWLAGDKTTTVGSFDSLIQQLSSIDSNQEESAS
jgi:hypothetical protein